MPLPPVTARRGYGWGTGRWLRMGYGWVAGPIPRAPTGPWLCTGRGGSGNLSAAGYVVKTVRVPLPGNRQTHDARDSLQQEAGGCPAPVVCNDICAVLG